MKPKELTTIKDESSQYVALTLNGESYGINIAHIHTVIVPSTITPVPRTPEYIKGVMSLRGQIIPVMDLRTRFGMPSKEHDSQTRIVILNQGELIAGLIVDSVTEVFKLSSSTVDAPPAMLATEAATCIQGIGKFQSGAENEEHLVLILETERLLSVTVQESHVAEAVAA